MLFWYELIQLLTMWFSIYALYFKKRQLYCSFVLFCNKWLLLLFWFRLVHQAVDKTHKYANMPAFINLLKFEYKTSRICIIFKSNNNECYVFLTLEGRFVASLFVIYLLSGDSIYILSPVLLLCKYVNKPEWRRKKWKIKALLHLSVS